MENDEEQKSPSTPEVVAGPREGEPRQGPAQEPSDPKLNSTDKLKECSHASVAALAAEVEVELNLRLNRQELNGEGPSARSYAPSPLDVNNAPLSGVPQEAQNEAVNANPDRQVMTAGSDLRKESDLTKLKEKHLVDLKQSSKESTGNPLLKFQYSANQMFEGQSIQDSEMSAVKNKSKILVEDDVTSRSKIEPNPQYRCVPVTDYRDLISGKKRKNNTTTQQQATKNFRHTNAQQRHRTTTRQRNKVQKTPKQNLQNSLMAANLLEMPQVPQTVAQCLERKGQNPNSIVIYQKAQTSLDKTLHRIHKNSPSIFSGGKKGNIFAIQAAEVKVINNETTFSSGGTPTSTSPRLASKRNSLKTRPKPKDEEETVEKRMRPKFDNSGGFTSIMKNGTIMSTEMSPQLDTKDHSQQNSIQENSECFTREHLDRIQRDLHQFEQSCRPQAYVRMETGQQLIQQPVVTVTRTAAGASGASSGLQFMPKQSTHAKSSAQISKVANHRNRSYITMNAEPNKFVVIGDRKKQRIEVSYAKLLSIAKGLQQNILPKTHTHLNEIYEQRLKKYLSLRAIHGDDNQTIADKLFNDGQTGDSELRNLQKKVKQRQLRVQSNENFRKDRQNIIENQPYYKTHSNLLDSVDEMILNQNSVVQHQQAGVVQLTEFIFDGELSRQGGQQPEQEILQRFNFGQQQARRADMLKFEQMSQKQHSLLHKPHQENTFTSHKTDPHLTTGHGSPKAGDHEKLMRTYDDLVVDQLIGSGSPILNSDDEGTPPGKEDGIYKIFCGLQNKNEDYYQYAEDDLNIDEQAREEDFSPATLSHADQRSNNRTPKVRSTQNGNNRTEASKSVLSKSFLERNGITTNQNEIAIFDQKRVTSEPNCFIQKTSPNMWANQKRPERKQRSPELASEMRVSKPMMKEENTIQPESAVNLNKTSHSLLNQAQRRALDQRAVKATSLNKTSESVTVASFQQNLSNSVMLKAHWHHGPIANLQFKRGSGGYEAENELVTNSDIGAPVVKSDPGETIEREEDWEEKLKKRHIKAKNSTRYQVLPRKTTFQTTKSQNKGMSGEENVEMDLEVQSPVVIVNELRSQVGAQKILQTSEFSMPLSNQSSVKRQKRAPFEGNKVKQQGPLAIDKSLKALSPKPYVLKASAKLPQPQPQSQQTRIVEFVPENSRQAIRMPVFFLPFQAKLEKTPQDNTTLAIQDEIQTDYDMRNSCQFQPVRLSKTYEFSPLRNSGPQSIQQVLGADPSMQATLTSQLKVFQQQAQQNSRERQEETEDYSNSFVDCHPVIPAQTQPSIPVPAVPQKQEVLSKLRGTSRDHEVSKQISMGDPMQIQIDNEPEEELPQPVLSQSTEGRSLVCLVTKKANELSPRYHENTKQTIRQSQDLEEVMDQNKYQTNIQISHQQKLLNHYAGQQQQYSPNISGQVYTQDYLNTLTAGLTYSARTEDLSQQPRFEEGLNHADKISLLTSIGNLDPLRQKALLMAVLRARINQLSSVENPFTKHQQQVPVKHLNLLAKEESTGRSSSIINSPGASGNVTPLQLPRQTPAPQPSKFVKKINTQFQQPNFKYSQAMVNQKANATSSTQFFKKSKSPKRSKTKSPDNQYQRELYSLLNKCLYSQDEYHEHVLELLLALERHDATVEEAKKNGTHIVQPTETRNLILTALLNIFMRLQTMEQSNANSGTTLLLQQGNPNIKVDQQDPIVQRLALNEINDPDKFKSRVVLSNFQNVPAEYRESKNIGTACNLPYFEEEGYMDNEYENMIGVDETIPESTKNFSSQKFESSKNSFNKQSIFAQQAQKNAKQNKETLENYTASFDGQKSECLIRPSTTKVKNRQAVPIPSALQSEEKNSAKSLNPNNYNNVSMQKVNSTLYRNTNKQSYEQQADIASDKNKEQKQNKENLQGLPIDVKDQTMNASPQGHQRRVLYQHQKKSSNLSSAKDECSTKQSAIADDIQEQNSVLIKEDHDKMAAGEFKVSEEESRSESSYEPSRDQNKLDKQRQGLSHQKCISQ